jgi:hypothetical protein
VIRASAAMLVLCGAAVSAQVPPSESSRFDTAQALFYNGRYAEAAAIAEALPVDDEAAAPAVYELRTSALLFQMRRVLGEPDDKGRAFRQCTTCAGLLDAFMREYAAGRSAARASVARNPGDAEARFYLGKLDLNYVWLMLGTVGRRTGWNEYWEARHSIEAVLDLQPDHVRARAARAWIDYIVDTRTPWGTKWLLGGGSRRRALAVMRDAAATEGDFYAQAEAMFGLWEMELREKDGAAALETARRLAVMFPANRDVARFVASARH